MRIELSKAERLLLDSRIASAEHIRAEAFRRADALMEEAVSAVLSSHGVSDDEVYDVKPELYDGRIVALNAAKRAGEPAPVEEAPEPVAEPEPDPELAEVGA